MSSEVLYEDIKVDSWRAERLFCRRVSTLIDTHVTRIQHGAVGGRLTDFCRFGSPQDAPSLPTPVNGPHINESLSFKKTKRLRLDNEVWASPRQRDVSISTGRLLGQMVKLDELFVTFCQARLVQIG